MGDAITRLKEAFRDRYGIERELGEGGMATVYLAEDLKHRRKVALKVLKPELAAVVGAERFLAEIRTTANLQHPHILPLFDSGEAGGFLFYVMPYVEGESLRERLDREGPFPVDEAVAIAVGVAEALHSAHRDGVVHRDVKPANVLLRAGKPLVADFGIALALNAAGDERLTETGLSVGTPHYMSPEQAMGARAVGPRSDVYSLASVLYEMLAGEPPHTGATAQAILSRILTATPEPVTARRETVPAHVDAAIRRALEKVPADRFGSAQAFAEALRNPGFRYDPRGADRSLTAGALADPVLRGLERTGAGTGVSRRHLLVAGAGALVLASLAAWGWLRTPPSAAAAVARVTIVLPADRQLWLSSRAFAFDLSRDGARIVYVGHQGGGTRLFLRELAEDAVRAVEGTEGAVHPVFSPDGDQVAFFSDGYLRRVRVDGGAPIEIAPVAGRPHGASWGRDGTILYVVSGSGLFRVAATGGSPIRIPVDPVNEPVTGQGDVTAELVAGGNPRWPDFLPDGKHALISLDGGSGVVALETGEFRYLLVGEQARYLPTGHVLYNAGRQRLRVARFDAGRREITGAEAPAIEDVFRAPASGAAHARVSDTGTLVYVAGGFDRSLVRVGRDGRATPVAVEARGYRFPALSPDGAYVAVTVDPRPSDIWIVDLRRPGAQRLTMGSHSLGAGWSPAGDRLAFNYGGDLRWLPWPAGGEPRRMADRPLPHYYPTWLSAGRIVVQEPHPERGMDLLFLNVDDGTTDVFLATQADEYAADASPDGRWVAFVSNLSGTDEVYVLTASAPAGAARPVQVSIGGGVDPRWSADGRELFYRSGNSILAVPVRTTPEFEPAGEPVKLFSGPYDFTQSQNWDVGPDGTFLMIQGDPRTTSQFQVVFGWFEILAGSGG